MTDPEQTHRFCIRCGTNRTYIPSGEECCQVPFAHAYCGLCIKVRMIERSKEKIVQGPIISYD